MKIVTWNCGGAFRNKYNFIEKMDADIYIIQECENPSKITTSNFRDSIFFHNHIWNGDNRNKGIAIFAKSKLTIEISKLDNQWRGRELKWFLPVVINSKLKLLGVWNHRAGAKAFHYIGQFWNLLQQNKCQLNDCIIIGDFNSNAIWDSWDRWWNHSDCVRELDSMNCKSVYHTIRSEKQGKEVEKTFFFHKKLDKGYHIDFIFSPQDILNKTKSFTIGNYEEWINFSDHMPLCWEY